MPTDDLTTSNNHHRFTCLLVVIFACLSAIGVSRHEMWRDELQAWTIARDSSSVVELWRNMRVENHPMLWHTLLFVLTRFTWDPAAMQYLHWGIAVASVYVFVRYSPLARFQKILFCFGYFPFYEYCAISRNYSLCMLLLFSFCALVQHQPRNYLALACVIGLLASSHFYDWAIALACIVVLISDYICDPHERQHLRQHRSEAVAAILIVLLLQGFAILEAWNYFGHIPEGKPSSFQLSAVGPALLFAWRVFFPIPMTDLDRFVWNSNFVVDTSSIGQAVTTVLSPLLLIPFLVVFWRRDRRAFLLYLSGTVLLWAGELAVGFGGLRHMGKHYLLLLASWWLAFRAAPQVGLGRWERRTELLASGLITAVLAVQLVAGVICFWVDLHQVFSAAKPTVQIILDKGLANVPIGVSPDAFATSISGYLGRSVYAVDSERLQDFTSWDKLYYAQTNSSAEVLQSTIRLLSGSTNRVFLITGGGDIVVQQKGTFVPIERVIIQNDYRVTKLAQFSNALIDEKFWIYLVERLPGTQSMPP